MGLIDDLKKRQAEEAAAKRAAPAPSTGGQVIPLDPGRVSRYAARALAEEVSDVLGAVEGTRNDALNRAAFNLGTLVGAGHLGRDDVEQQLSAAGLQIGLEPSEVRKTIASGLGKGIASPREVTLTETSVRVTEVSAEELTRLSEDDEAEFWASRALLTHLHTFARARLASPWAVLGAALARMATATPWDVTLPPVIGGRGSLNLFVGLVGHSGDGKGIAEAAAADALDMLPIRKERIASGEAIAHVFKRRGRGKSGEPAWRDEEHAALVSVAEIDRLAGQANRQGATIMADLRSAWSGEMLGQIAADPSRSIPVEAHQYRLCLLAGIQPHRAGVLLEDADGGTPQRFIWLPVLDPHMPDEPPAEPNPWPWEPPSSFGRTDVKIADPISEELRAVHRSRHRGEGEALASHHMQARLKVAAVLGVADGRHYVTESDWALAGVIMRKSDQTRGEVIEAMKAKAHRANVSRAEAEALRADTVDRKREEVGLDRALDGITRKLRAVAAHETDEPEWVTRRDLIGRLSRSARPYFEQAITRLVEARQVEAGETDRGGKRYRLSDVQ